MEKTKYLIALYYGYDEYKPVYVETNNLKDFERDFYKIREDFLKDNIKENPYDYIFNELRKKGHEIYDVLSEIPALTLTFTF